MTSTTMPPTRLPLAKSIVLVMAGVPTTLCLTVVGPILPRLEDALAVDATDRLLVKMVMAVTGVSIMFGAPAAGWLADKVGRPPLLIWALLLFVPLGCSVYFTDDLLVIVGTRILLGLFAATIFTVAITMIGDIPDQHSRNRIIGFQVSAATLSAAVSLPLAGLLGDIEWRLPFALYLAPLPLAAVACWAFRKDPARPSPRQEARSSEERPARFSMPVGLIFLALVAGSVASVPGAYMPFQIRDIGVTSSGSIGFAMMVSAVISGVIAGFYGRVRKYISPQMVFASCFGVSAIGLGLFVLAESYAGIIGALVVVGFGTSWLTTNTVACATEAATDATRGRVVGMVKGSFFAASFLTVLILEPIVRVFGPKGALVALAALSLLASLAFIASKHLRSRSPAPEAVG
jgi:MFS family permease